MTTSKKSKKLNETEHKITAHDLAKKQREISVSEFFIKNRHLLGFDNPRKALLTTINPALLGFGLIQPGVPATDFTN